MPREKFFQFSWRPRAPSLLSAEQEQEIQRNLKTTYSRRYEEEDQAALQEVRLAISCLHLRVQVCTPDCAAAGDPDPARLEDHSQPALGGGGPCCPPGGVHCSVTGCRVWRGGKAGRIPGNFRVSLPMPTFWLNCCALQLLRCLVEVRHAELREGGCCDTAIPQQAAHRSQT